MLYSEITAGQILSSLYCIPQAVPSIAATLELGVLTTKSSRIGSDNCDYWGPERVPHGEINLTDCKSSRVRI